jgi:AcrR family transcriptional regulator
LQDVANEIGISGPAIYQYFKNKEELFLSLYESSAYHSIFEELTSLLQKNDNYTLEDIRKILIDLGDAFLYITGSHSEMLRMWISEARRYPQIGQNYVENQMAPVEAQVKGFLDFYVACGLLDIQDTLLAAHAFFGMFFNIVLAQDLMHAQDYLKRPRGQMISQMVDIFIKGIKKE